jgi:sRNA-binding protein
MARGEAAFGRNSSGADTTMTEEELRQLYPHCFNDQRKTLALGIHANMGITYGDKAMEAWVSHPKYLRNMLAAGAARVDLTGAMVGVVTAEERERAWLALIEIRNQIYRQRREQLMNPSKARWLPFSKEDENQEIRKGIPKSPKTKQW